MNLLNLAFRWLMVFGVSLLSACASVGDGKRPAAASLDQLIAESESAGKAGLKEKVTDLLNRAAKENPTRKEPWLKLAQQRFDAQDYGQAIVAAEEALQRDAKDPTAKSILAVSGLRVSAKALGLLRDEQSMNGDVRAEAKTLVKILREAFGETDLLPAGQKVADGAKVPPEGKKMPARVVRPVVVVSNPKPEKPAAEKQGTGDPFSALK